MIAVLLVVSPFLVLSAQAAEPSLEEVLDYLGFTYRTGSSAETFSAGTYEITLYAEFAGYHDRNELSYYEVGTSVFNVIFTGPEGGPDYIDPPVTKSFTADYQFGLSMLSRESFRYFTETSRNGDGLQHAKVYENLDDPGMFLIGFENQWGGGDKDYNDMVFSLKPMKQPPVALFDYSPLYPVANETVTFNASDSYDPDGSIVSYHWDFGDGNITTVNDPIITHIYTAGNSTINYTVTLTVTDNDDLTNSTAATVPVTNPAILRVSIPSGEDRTEIWNPDPWLSQCWLLNITDASGTFTVRIEDVSWCISSYDTRLVIALNDAAHNNLVSLSVNGTPIGKNDFKNGILRPYSLRDWPSGDVYPTWFNDTLVNVGTIPPKGYKDVTVSVTFSNATGVRMHFDAYGSKKSSPIPPTKECYITHNPLSEDSTVLLSPPPAVKYYLTVISPYGTPSGEGWYDNCTTAYATLNTGIVDHGNGTRRVFTHWSGDASGTNYAQSNPIHMDQNKTAIANWKTQYYLTLTTNPPGVTTPSGEGWYDAGTYASISTSELVPGGSRYRFTGWTTSNISEITDPASPSTTVLMDEPKTVTANYIIQYNVTFTQTGLSSDATGTVVTVNGSAKTFGDLPFDIWVDTGSILTYSYESTVSSTTSGKQYRLDSVTGPTSPITVTADTTVTGNYITQYLVTFAQTGLDSTATGTVLTVNGDTKTFFDLPNTTWVDDGGSVSYSYSDTVSSSTSGKRFSLVGVTGPSSPISVTGPVTVTGNYKTQYEVTFDQSGVGTDFTGTVVTIDGAGYGVGDLSVSFWWDAGSSHNFSFASPLVVNASKQYVWIFTSGLSSSQNDTLTITSPGSVTGYYSTGVKYQITFDQTGIGSDFSGTIVIIDGTPYNRTALPVSFWWDEGSIHSFAFQSPLVVTSNAKRYVWNSTSGLSSLQSDSITVSTSGSVIGNYKTQYYLTVISPYGTPGGEGWYNSSTLAYASLDTGMIDHGNDTRRVFTNWSGDASGTNYSQSDSIHMDGAKTAIANWKTQYYLTVTTNPTEVLTLDPLAVSGSGWYDSGSTAVVNAVQNVDKVAGSSRYDFRSWTGATPDGTKPGPNPATVLMDAPKTATANYVLQYRLTLAANPPITTPSGEGWYDTGTYASISTAPLVDIVPGASRYSFSNWTTGDMGEIADAYSPSTTVLMDKAKTVTANYVTQYYLTVETDPSGLSPQPDGEGWYNASTSVDLTAPDPSYLNSVAYNFTYWDVDGTSQGSGVNPITVHMDTNHTATAHYQGPPPKYYLTVKTDPDGVETIPGEDWYDNCTYVNLNATEFVPVSPGVRYRFDYWDVDGGSQGVGVNPINVHMDDNHTATAHYVIQYLVTFNQTGLDETAIGTVVTVDTSAKTYDNLPFSMWVDSGTEVTYSYETYVSTNTTGKRFRLDSVTGPSSPITVTGPTTVTGNYVTQYYLTVTSPYGTPIGEDWYDESTDAYAGLNTGVVSGPTGTQYVFVQWTGNASGTDYAQSNAIHMDAPKTAIAEWKTQYYLTVVSPYDTPGGMGWYDSSTDAYANLATGTVDHGNGTRRVFTHWSGDASGTGLTSDPITMNTPKTAVAIWKTEYYLTVTSPYGSPTPTSGWFEAGESITASVTSPVSGPSGTRYVCTGWTGTGNVPTSGTTTSVTFTINAPSSITWNWKTQYYLTVRTNPYGLSPAPTPPSQWYDESTNVDLTAYTVIGYTFDYWDVDGTPQGSGVNPITVHMDGPHTATAHYQPTAQPPPGVGGYAAPINIAIDTSNSLFPQIGLVSVLPAAIAVAIILTRRKKKTLKREH